MTNIHNSIIDLETFGMIVIIIGVFLLILMIATCFSIIKMKDAINDIADTYCKINKDKYREIVVKEESNKEAGQ